jgi:spore germination protein
MHLSTLTEEGRFDNARSTLILEDADAQDALVQSILETVQARHYFGLDVDFEYVLPEQREAYAAFITRLREALNPLGCPVVVALAPKTSAAQRGLLYEAHDYALLGAAANAVFLMTYEWGYTYGPPMAVAPLGQVRAVLDYALTAVAPEKIFMGIPLYGYDWPLPFVSGKTRAESLSPVQAVERALRHDIAIQYDAAAQAPYYHYTDRGGREHAVWFEDARSIEAKLRLADEYHLQGVGYWNLTRPFPQNWAVLASLFDIETLL